MSNPLFVIKNESFVEKISPKNRYAVLLPPNKPLKDFNYLTMMIKEQYEAPEILVEDYVCECGFLPSGVEGAESEFGDGEDGEIEDLY